MGCPAAARILSLVLFVGGATARVAAEERDLPAGGHPLARRSGSLADLLEQPDWAGSGPPAKPPAAGRTPAPPAPRPPSGSAPAPAEPPADRPLTPAAPATGALVRLQELVRDRHGIVDRCRLFDTLAQGFAAEAAVQKAQADVQTALRSGAAPKRIADLQKQVSAKTAALKPIADRLHPEIQPWVGSYLALRGLLEPQRADELDEALTAALEQEIGRRDDFLEGRILAGLRRGMAGDEAASAKHLERAGEAIVKYRLFLCPMAHDCCHAWLLLGRPSEVSPYVDRLKKLDVAFQTPDRCRLVALQQAELGRYLVAKDYFDRALRRLATITDEGILGDAAFFYLAAGNDQVRQPEKGIELLGHVAADATRWEVVRARAAAAAERGEWQQAATLMEDCAKAVPAAFRDEAAEQLAAYTAHKPWHARSGVELRTAE